MGIRIHHLPPGTDEAKWEIFRKAIGNIKGLDYSGVHYLCPNQHFRRAWQRGFHDLIGGAYISPQSSTLAETASSLYRTYGTGGIVPKELVPVIISGLTGFSMGHATLIADLIKECKEHYPGQTPKEIKDTLINAVSEAGLHEAVASRIEKSMEAFGTYQQRIEEKNSLDPDDIMAQAAELAGEYLDIELLILDGFYELTPAETRLAEALISSSKETVITVPVSSINDDLSYCYTIELKDKYKAEHVLQNGGTETREMTCHAAPSMEEEVEAVARQIKSNFISGKWRELEEIMVVFPRLSDYRDMAERVFGRYGIPVNLTETPRLIQTRAYQDLIALLESVAEDFPRLRFARVLTSSSFKGISGELRSAVPSIVLNAGLVKGKTPWLNAFRDKDLYPRAVSLLRKFEPLINLKYKATYKSLSNALLEVLKDLVFMLPGEDNRTEAEAVIARLGQLDNFLNREVTLSEYIESLRRVLSVSSREPETPGVQVASLFQVRGLEPKVLYLGGLKDGDIPSRPDIDYLLPDTVRKVLGLKDMQRHMHLQEHIFRRLSLSARTLYLSYPSMEGEKFYLPSVFLSGAQERSMETNLVLSEQERQLRLGASKGTQFPAYLGEVSGIKRYTGNSPIRITDIDAYRSCPRRFFIERTLDIRPQELMDYEIEPRELGIVVHEVMERLIRPELDALDAFTARAADILDEVLAQSQLDDYLKSLLRETFIVLVPEIYEIEEKLREEGFVFEQAEELMEEEPLPGIRLKGKVDRIDRAPDGRAEVIDYKTGAVALTGSKVISRGENLQLFLYAAMLKARGQNPERVGIYSLKDIHLKWVPSVVDLRKGFTLEDMITSALQYLESTVHEMREGNFPARPLDDQRCRNCHERPYCPYIQGGETS